MGIESNKRKKERTNEKELKKGREKMGWKFPRHDSYIYATSVADKEVF
jgi:hypothetical protein